MLRFLPSTGLNEITYTSGLFYLQLKTGDKIVCILNPVPWRKMQLLLKSISIIKCGTNAILVASTMRRSFPGVSYASLQSTPANLSSEAEITALSTEGEGGWIVGQE